MLTQNKNKVDLHLHSIYSDGTLSPADVVKLSHSAGLSIISIVDHDNILGLEESEEAAKSLNVEVIPGVELSSTMNQKEVHILGYFIDRKNIKLIDYLSFFRDERRKRAERIVKKLNSLNIPLKIETVLRKTILGSIGRPHVAYALLEGGYIGNYDEAFEKYIGLNGPAYEEKIHFSPKDAIELISQAGGLSFLAHPNKTLNENELLNLIDLGIDGIEVIHPSHSHERINYFKGITSEYFLLESGGSDFHGGRKRDEVILGQYTVSAQAVENMKRRLFK
jgi:predicted metal-dependent phosphoesterase TrpH